MTADTGGPDPVVEISGLVKRYAGRAVVDGLDLTVRRGEIVALLGPNGAGKTTTVEIIEGYRHPDAGTVRVFGLDPADDPARLKRRIGIMLQRGELQSQITVREALELFAAFYRRPLDPAELLEPLGLEAIERRRYRVLSGGERQRLHLALALIGRPELAILDEPTSALDVTTRRTCWDLLRALRDAGGTVLLTTHLIEEAELLADRVAIMDAGRLLAFGDPRQIRAGDAPHGETQVRLRLRRPLEPEAIERLRRVPGVARLDPDPPDAYVLATTAPMALLMHLATWLWAEDREAVEIRVGARSLEDVFLRLTARAGPDAPPAVGASEAEPPSVGAGVR